MTRGLYVRESDGEVEEVVSEEAVVEEDDTRRPPMRLATK